MLFFAPKTFILLYLSLLTYYYIYVWQTWYESYSQIVLVIFFYQIFTIQSGLIVFIFKFLCSLFVFAADFKHWQAAETYPKILQYFFIHVVIIFALFNINEWLWNHILCFFRAVSKKSYLSRKKRFHINSSKNKQIC